MVSMFFFGWPHPQKHYSTAWKVKKDDAEGLAALLDNLEEGESWEDPTAIAICAGYILGYLASLCRTEFHARPRVMPVLEVKSIYAYGDIQIQLRGMCV